MAGVYKQATTSTDGISPHAHPKATPANEKTLSLNIRKKRAKNAHRAHPTEA